MGKSQLGRRLERQVAQLLKDGGWAVRIVEPAIKYIPAIKRHVARPQDIFGADIVAMRDGSPMLFVQVTADSSIKKRVQEFSQYPFPFPLVIVLLVQAKKRGNKWCFKVGRYHGGDVIEWAGPIFLGEIFGRAFFDNRSRFIFSEENF